MPTYDDSYKPYPDGGVNPPIYSPNDKATPSDGGGIFTKYTPIPPLPLPGGKSRKVGTDTYSPDFKVVGPDTGPPVLPPGGEIDPYDPYFGRKPRIDDHPTDYNVPKKSDPRVIDPPTVVVPPNPCIELHEYGHVLWDYGFQWPTEVVNFAASPEISRIAAFDDMSFNTLVGVRNNEFSYSGKKFRVVCTGYYIRDFLCDVASVTYSTISSFNVSIAKYNIPKLNGEFYITTNGKLCKLDVVPEGRTGGPDIGDDTRTPPPYQPPITPPGPPVGSGQVYGTIYSDDILNDIREVCTKELWCNGVSTLQNHFRDVTSSLDDVDFIMDVYDRDLNDQCKCRNYKILYGDYDGKGAIDLGGLDSETMTKAIYSMYANVLLPHQQTKFNINGTDQDYVYIIDIRRDRYGTSMDTGNWELNLGRISSSITTGTTVSSSISFINWSTTGSFIDNSVATGSVHLTNKVYHVIQGTLEDGVTTSGSIIGNFYPNHGTIVLSGERLDTLFNFNTNRNVQKHGLNPLRLFTSISGASAPDTYTDASGDEIGFKGRKLNISHSKYVFVRVKNQLFNFSNNPTFVTGSEGEIIDSFKGIEKAWITTVGLYNPQKELLAIAKLPKPYLKSSTEEALFTIRVGQTCCRD